ncbi:SixA phosphatase family protein [Cellulomonas marina]|uniref:Phosphohistidine phosphatase n=1 Tax=Cellulomonas marina TaxID=988821 RepID=A0A1I0ZSJ6_9CELL|nr:histidine phosphatase family protein [Cellulomonas marina]GIG28806.1 phosphohistidine phosphatase [Cellulomonas marina]SFB28352.1 phosphohistidine phosphatase [Cellulomonas marina]
MTADDPRRLVLLRHARAEHTTGADHVRPLAVEGRRQAQAVGATLAGLGLVPDLVLCSSALRTRQTWELVRQGLGTPAGSPPVEVRDALYESGLAELVALVGGAPADARTVLVVGHEPTISMASAALAGPGSDEAVVARVRTGLPTAGWTLLTLGGGWPTLAPRAAALVRAGSPD